jgi:parallel beta-helix repeat protein
MGFGMHLRAAIGAATVAAGLIAALPGGAAATPGCDLAVAVDGNDAAAGTLAAPFRDPVFALDRLAPGQTLCFGPGTHTWSGGLRVDTPGVILTSTPGTRATLQGNLRVEIEASGAVIENLKLDGRNPDDYFNPLIYADRVVLRNNEITNGHTTNCVHLAPYYDNPGPTGVIIENNDIHGCGTFPVTNHEHAIYLADAYDTIIRNNRIWDNADRGIQLFTQVEGTRIYGNVIDGNGSGVLFAGMEGVMPTDTVVEHNLITNSNVRHNIESSFDEQTAPARDNLVRDNCIFGAEGWYKEADGSGIMTPESGFTATGNIIADPQYVDRKSGDFTLQPGSPCADVLGDPEVPVTGKLSLSSRRTEVRAGAMTKLRGKVPAGITGQVTILRSRSGNWAPYKKATVRGAGFKVRTRVNTRSRFKARATGARDSNAVKVNVTGKKGKG